MNEYVLARCVDNEHNLVFELIKVIKVPVWHSSL